MTTELPLANTYEPELIAALEQVLQGLAAPENHYVVWANYYNHLTPGREGERWHIAQLWLNADTTSNVVMMENGLACNVFLNRQDLTQLSRIVLPYDQIWWVQQIKLGHRELYHRSDKLNLKRPGDEPTNN